VSEPRERVGRWPKHGDERWPKYGEDSRKRVQARLDSHLPDGNPPVASDCTVTSPKNWNTATSVRWALRSSNRWASVWKK
jgi:hypothetical protein